jgi:hypothetical protein
MCKISPNDETAPPDTRGKNLSLRTLEELEQTDPEDAVTAEDLISSGATSTIDYLERKGLSLTK